MGDGTELLEAARAGELERVKVLVEQDTNADKDNALRLAAREGRRNVVQYLVEHGAAVNAKDYLGDTALMRAAEGGHTTVVQFLTEGCKADVNESNENGYTALIWAARSGHEEVVRYITGQRGVEVDVRDKNGYTALMKACKGGHIKVLRSLAAAGADVDGNDDFGYTALMIASGCGHNDIVKFLVEECHVVVNSRNNLGETAVRVASDCGHGDVERYLTPFLLHSPPSYVSAATSTTESDVLETQTMSIPPSEIEPIDFSTSSGMGPDYHRVKWLEADVFVKLLRTDSDHSSLEKEVHLWQGLRHPNVMNFYGVCDSVPQLQLFVCEYSSKGTLLDHVKSDSVERSSVWRYLHEAAVGLAYLHRKGIVHGDLRCSNILIGNDGMAKLYNMELSGLLDKSSDVSASANVWVRWQAPEVLRGEKLSLQSDVYSLGMCILEVVTREMPWEDCASDNAVRDRKLRWAPESTVDENLEPRCPLGAAKTLVWRMCCQDPDKRASIASVVCGLERLAVEEVLDPEPDLPFDFYNFHDEFMRKMWRHERHEKMTVFYHDAFDEIKKVQKRLQDSRYRAALFDQFGALSDGFRTMIAVRREHDIVLNLPASGDTSTSIVAFCQQLRAIWNALGETTDLAREREVRWERSGWPRAEIVISGVSNTICFLGEVETQEERSNLLASLRSEIDQSFKYTPDELGLLKKAFEDLSSTDEHETLSHLTPQWFIPWYEVLIDESRCLGEGAFGSVYRAKWLDSDVVVKSVSLVGPEDLMLSSSVYALTPTEDPRIAAWRAEALAMFRGELDLWFGFNHPHVVRLFGACHVGTPFFVCEYAPNGTMVNYLRKHPAELWLKLLEVALGVQYLHARGVVHGDLKGNNIVVGGDLKAKVTDFGLSFVATRDAEALVSGACHWVAPECLRDDRQRPTFSSDVYSLGMCIVEALRIVEAVKSGNNSHDCLPWIEADHAEVKFHATRGNLPPRPFCEDSQWELVTQMCKLEPTKRLSIAEVVDKLTRLASGQPNDLTDISPTRSFELRLIPQVAETAQRLLARLQQESRRDEVASVLLLYVSLWNRLEQIHGQISIKNGDNFRAEFGSIVGEVDLVTSKLQKSTTSLALAELALRCYAFERRLDKLGGGDTDLMWAAKNGRIEVVRELIENGADVNVQDDNGTTALMAAAEYDQLEMVKFLIEHGASLATTDDNGDTALMIAAGKGSMKVCQHLAEQPGTDVNATNDYQHTALMAAARSGHLKVVQYLAPQHGCDGDVAGNYRYALLLAIVSGATDVVRCLVEDCGVAIDFKTEDGETVLMIAAFAGHFDLCQYFAEQDGADVNAANGSGDTALIMAARSGQSKIVRCLVDIYGTDVNHKNNSGDTALMRAARNGHVEVVRCLVEQRGIDVNARNQRGQTAIRLAVEHGDQEIRRMLTPFLPPRPIQSVVGGGLSSNQSSGSLISASEVEFVRFCENGNIGGEYRAKWLDADAVVKLFVADASTTTFAEEVRLWQQLRHPNVMKMYGASYAPPNLQFFVCEYISDGSLIEHVELASVKRPTVWKFLHEAALGLTYLHERGIIHGDLRCSNILLGSDGLAKLSNFGLSGSVKRSDRDSSGVVGSKRWLACEVLQGEQPSIASDVYSLGMCILEATTREKPWGCESEQVVEKYKKRWTPETDAYSFGEPDCASGDARKLVWRMCSNDAARRVNLTPVVDELERLAIAESSNSSQPELEPANLSENSKLKELWLEVQTHMESCGDDQYHRAFNGLKRVRDGVESSADNNSPVLLERFHTLLTDFYRIITMSPEQASIMRLWSTRSTTASMNAIHLCIESLLTLLGDSADSTNVRQDRWQQQRSEQIELFVSGVEDTSFLLERLQTAEERAVFLKTLKAEMDDPQSQYTPAQFEVVKKAYETIARTIESEDLSKLIPEWFIPRFELFIDGWRCLGSGGFGCVYRAKWLGSDVVAKLLGSEGDADLFAPNAQSSQSNFSALLDLSSTRSLMDSTTRGEAIATFRHEVDIWFGFNHPHVVRLFGACHVGTPFFACEYATNGTLVKYLETHPGELWAKLHEAALGVQYLHARKVVHGDLKGNNIVVGSDMKAKVTDFGLSSIAGNDAKPQISGAWHWVAPECLPNDIPNAAVKSPTFESDIYSLGMCIVEAMRVVENVERVKSGKEPQRCLPWGGLDNFLVRFHATKGTLPSTPSICSDDQWELVKQMCAFKPKSRVKISTVVDRLAHLAKHQETSGKATSDPKSVPEAIAAARELLDRLRSEERQASVVQLHTLLWDRLEQTIGNVNDKLGEEGQDAFYSLVAEANEATSDLQGASQSLISSAEITMRYYALDRRLDKFCDAYHRLLNPSSIMSIP